MGILTWLFGRSKREGKMREDSLSLLTADASTEQSLETLDGRQILAHATYVLPKDGEEINRLDFQHFMLRNVMQGNYIAPLTREMRTILDVGCGTGRWGYEMAQEFPEARVIGVDLIEQRSQQSGPTPLNFRFVIGDAIQGLPFDSQSFDFVHQRLLFLAIPATAWQAEINELARLVRPGGWLELVETEFTGTNLGPSSQQIARWMIALAQMRGSDPSRTPDLARHLQLAGMENITTRSYPIPVGNWGGRLGTMMATDMSSVIKAMRPLIISKLNIDADLFDRTVARQREEWEEKRVTATFFAAYARKPV